MTAAVEIGRPHGRARLRRPYRAHRPRSAPHLKELADWSNGLARALIEDCGVKPGARILIRSANNPAMIACWLAATKAGAVAVNTMPMLRAEELTKIVDKARLASP